MSHHPEYLIAGHFPPEKLASASTLFHSGKSFQSAASMNSGSLSRHYFEAKEEDSPLQQSAFTSNQPMADSYPEDITSKAEEEAEDHTVREMADEEENDGGADEEEIEQGDGIEAEEEQILANIHSYWVKCHVKDVHVQALENEGLVAPRAESQWRTDLKALVLALNQIEILMLKSHMERGLSMPPSHFFSNLLKFYGLQLHHIALNSLVSMVGYAALCKGYFRSWPRVDLF
jgi:hypothetical protein